jgi:prepilin-type N-terminal cleavage/methylation domain-containing protein
MMNSKPRHNSRRAFTLVELIAVIGIIAVLMGLLVVGIRGAMNSARKLGETNNLRSLAVGWTLQNRQNNDELMPGFVEMNSSANLCCGTTFRTKNGAMLPWNMCATYPMRILPFVDYQSSVLWGYLGLSDADLMTAKADDWQPTPEHLDSQLAALFDEPGSKGALQPAFGYNGIYVGGWSSRGTDHCCYLTDQSRWTDQVGKIHHGGLRVTNANHIRYPDRLVTFAASTFRARGQYKRGDASESYAPGCAWVIPPAYGQVEMWNSGGGSALQGVRLGLEGEPSSAFAFAPLQAPSVDKAPINSDLIVVNYQHGVPIRRFTRMTSLMNADASISEASPAELVDMRRWINVAWKPDFRHGDEEQ